LSRSACERRASRAALSTRLAPVMRGASAIPVMEREPCAGVNLPGQSPWDLSGGNHSSTRRLTLAAKNHANRLPGCVFGGLVGMDAPPRRDPGAIALDRGPSGFARRLERVEHRIRGAIRCRVDCRGAPHHHRLQGEKCPKFQGALRLSHAGRGRNALKLVGKHAEPPRVPLPPDAAGSGGHTSKHQQLPRPNPRRNAASAAGFVVACQKHEYFGSLRSSL
jgi:hypothetical protein